ncbi:hypothetical protein [uncultured Desulfovibrio sp.]|uniref:hypothetical protein n=1 Tax=uncultured Desulfovibrio sp. TaxID=167968 RepID=UPI0025912207|nr:hypothetical protein [uncultured Desulfovibrio sp.]
MGMTLFGIGIYPNDFRFIFYALSGSVWLHSVKPGALLLITQIFILMTGLSIWFWRPNLLTATMLALAGMFGGPFAVWALGYPQFSIPIASLVFLAGFLLHCIWRKHTASRSVPRP